MIKREIESLEIISAIEAGHEGKKWLADVEITGEARKRYFVKSLRRVESFRQTRICRELRERNIPVPDYFETFWLPGEKVVAVVTDLSSNGTNWVLSSNNPELQDRTIWPEIADYLKPFRDDIFASVTQMTKDATGFRSDDIPQYYIDAHVYMLVVDKAYSQPPQLLAADFGISNIEQAAYREDPRKVLRSNSLEAEKFCSSFFH